MPLLDLSADELLATTRAVRKRLDLTRPVEPEVIRQCLELAVQAPTGANRQGWHFVIVTETEQRQALTALYRKGWALYRERMRAGHRRPGPELTAEHMATLRKVLASAVYEVDPLLWKPETFGLTPHLLISNRADIAE